MTFDANASPILNKRTDNPSRNRGRILHISLASTAVILSSTGLIIWAAQTIQHNPGGWKLVFEVQSAWADGSRTLAAAAVASAGLYWWQKETSNRKHARWISYYGGAIIAILTTLLATVNMTHTSWLCTQYINAQTHHEIGRITVQKNGFDKVELLNNNQESLAIHQTITLSNKVKQAADRWIHKNNK